MSIVEARQCLAVVKLKACPRREGDGEGCAPDSKPAPQPARSPPCGLSKVTTNRHTGVMRISELSLAIKTVANEINDLRAPHFIPVGNHGEINPDP